MLQRKQSLFLLASALCMFLMLAAPYWKISDTAHTVLLLGGSMELTGADGLQTVMGPLEDGMQLMMTLWLTISGLLALVLIFLFSDRPRQALIAGILMVVELLTGVSAGWMVIQMETKLTEAGATDLVSGYEWGAVLPVIAMVFTWFARRSILKDEALVRSVDRLR